MSSAGGHARPERTQLTPTATWLRRCLIVITAVGLVALGGAIIWLLRLIAGPLMLLVLSALLAYVLYPSVARAQRHMPRSLAILVVCLGVLIALALVAFGVLSTLISQLAALAEALSHITSSQTPAWAQRLGISADRLHASGTQVASDLQTFAATVVPLIGNVFLFALRAIIVAALLVYFILYGPRLIAWIRRETPLSTRAHINFFLDAVHRVMAAFLRGAVFLACLMGAITGVGALLLGIPYWLIIAVVVFLCEFVPVIGAYISGFVGTLLALSQGWQTALIYLVFATILQGFLDAQVLIPRIIGKHTGVNPIVATFALLVGASLFGIAGAVLAIPIVAVAQILLVAAWQTYHRAHPEEFLGPAAPDGTPTAEPSPADGSHDGALAGSAEVARG